MGWRSDSEDAVPSFDEAPSVILVAGDIDFFVEEAADRVSDRLALSGAEVRRFSDDAPPEAISEALLNRSLFSARRVVRIDAGRLLGSDSPAELLRSALEAWDRGGPAGRREAFRKVRALLASVAPDRSGNPAAVAEKLAARLRMREAAAPLSEILADLPEEKDAGSAVPALKLLLERGNDGVVALLTAVSPPRSSDLFKAIEAAGLVLDRAVPKRELPEALARLARTRAREEEVAIDADAITRLVRLTESPARFDSELSRLFGWAGKGGRIRASDVGENVPDESSEDVYAFFDAVGRRDAAEALTRLERIFSGREVRMGEREAQWDEDYWPVIFFGMVTAELRRMLLLRAAFDGLDGEWDPRMSSQAFERRILPRLKEPIPPFGKSAFEGHPFLWYKVAQRAARYRTEELARALALAAAVDAALKFSTPPLPLLSGFVAGWIAGDAGASAAISGPALP